jgi:uncharacterized protein YutE (UPF0331/DUF86 family)
MPKFIRQTPFEYEPLVRITRNKDTEQAIRDLTDRHNEQYDEYTKTGSSTAIKLVLETASDLYRTTFDYAKVCNNESAGLEIVKFYYASFKELNENGKISAKDKFEYMNLFQNTIGKSFSVYKSYFEQEDKKLRIVLFASNNPMFDILGPTDVEAIEATWKARCSNLTQYQKTHLLEDARIFLESSAKAYHARMKRRIISGGDIEGAAFDLYEDFKQVEKDTKINPAQKVTLMNLFQDTFGQSYQMYKSYIEEKDRHLDLNPFAAKGQKVEIKKGHK